MLCLGFHVKVRIHHCWSPTEVKQFCQGRTRGYSVQPRLLSLDLSDFESMPQGAWCRKLGREDFQVVGTQSLNLKVETMHMKLWSVLTGSASRQGLKHSTCKTAKN